MQIKRGDKYPVTFTVNMDLTNATTRLLVRHLKKTGTLEELDHTVTDAEEGTIEYELDGTWAAGIHYLELEITRDGLVRTAPTEEFLVVTVDKDLDAAT